MAENDNNKTNVPIGDSSSPNDGTAPSPKAVHKRGRTRADGAEDKVSVAEEKIAAAEQRVADAEQRVAEINDRLLRTAAEYDNHRRRSQKEHESAFGNGVGFAVQELLPVLDALDCAALADTTDEEYKKGVLMTLSKCEEVFTKLGITEIPALGKPFDPMFHNAVLQQAAEGAESGTITQVVQKGYLYKDKVIRHAMVAVAP